MEELLHEVLGGIYGPDLRIEGLRRDSAGASRLTTAFDAVTGTGERHALILRRDTPGGAATGNSLEVEAALMRAAAAVGAPSPEVVAAGEDYIVMSRIEGETIPRRILRAPELAEARAGLAAECGEILASIHRIPADSVPGLPDEDQFDLWELVLDGFPDPYPALELALRRLRLTRPEPSASTVVHGDFRNGNLIIGPDGVRAVLDWELSHVGDPLEDLGWLCAKPWRFGSPLPVGGFGGYDELVEAYERASGTKVDREALRWWELYGVLRWGIICIVQTSRHLTGGERSVELAALGRRVAENEFDLLTALV
ncbi:phosphotransferase family protein [Actinocorallia aurea]